MSLLTYEYNIEECVKRGLYTKEEIRQERDRILSYLRDQTKEYSKLSRAQYLLHFIHLFARLERSCIDVSMF